MLERVDRVTITMGRNDVIITWACRAALLSKLRTVRRAAGVIQAFEAVGATRPVELSIEQKVTLHSFLEAWSGIETPEGFTDMPPGLLELRNALSDDFHDAEHRAE